MIKFGLKFLQDKKKEEKNLNQEIIPELPAFEWQVTEETGFESCLLKTSLTTLIPPEDAILGVTDKTDRRRKSTICHSRSSTNVESGRIRLMQIIDDKNSRKNFRNYLVSRYCEENLDFYMDILKFHSNFKKEILNNEEIIKTANYIWNEYLDPQTSSKPLNVPQELLNQCKQKISQNSFTIDLFDKLQQHCFDLMLQDSLPKFKRNSMAITSSSPSLTENYLNSSSSSLCYLRPPSLRKSISSGSLRAKMNSAIASLKTNNETTSPYISPPPSPIPPQFSSQSPASSPTSTNTFLSTSSSTTTSTSTTFSIPTTPTSTTPTVINNQQRMSMASAMSISHITKKMLLGRRNSISSNQFSVTALSSVFYLSSLEKFRHMPGSYPCSSDDKKENNNNSSSTWQKLKRNISTPNFQSRPRSRSSTLFNVNNNNNNNQTNDCDKKLPPLPS